VVKRASWIVLGALVLVTALTPPAWAGDKEPQMVLVEDNPVVPAQVEAYEAFVKEFVAQMEAFKFPYPCYTYTTSDLHYLYVFPVADFADIGKLFAAVNEMVAKWGKEKFAETVKKSVGTYKYQKFSLYLYRSELSYVPEGVKEDPENLKFVFWGTVQGQPGRQKELEASFKQFVDLYQGKKVQHGWRTYMTVFGGKGPEYVYSEHGPSAGKFWTEVEEIDKEIGEPAKKAWMEMTKVIRGYHYSTGSYRPDLSYIPKADQQKQEQEKKEMQKKTEGKKKQ
jgi:hypothetical protein